jgi:plasmid segregation protein ParM
MKKIWRKNGMEKHIEVIGIDHGWSKMKTATQIFTTGVKEITTEPAFYDDVVELDGKYYKVGGKRLEVRDTKVENDNFYLLTLAAVAKELNRRGMRNTDVLLMLYHFSLMLYHFS